ncbi:restriction endonuclease subunit S [Limosilactobacillus reuteri]|uniref:restriction endonuclease subunit S n=2 Tax=Limosilactobacillus reuteri TaxID=1598 RepID=UPI001E2D95BC|nr:restriction endonuclease subunit S [Limosilactobacillus reuteri]
MKYKLKDIGKITTGKTPSKSIKNAFGGNMNFLTPTDFNGKRYSDSTVRSLSDNGVEAVSNYVVKYPSISVTCIGSDMGKTILNRTNIVSNQQINSISEIIDDINPKYLYYLLTAKRKYLHFLGSGQGSTMPILNKRDFGNIEFFFPEKEQQDSIVKILDVLDKKIELNKAINDNLVELVDSYFINFLNNVTTVEKTIEDIGTVVGGGTPSKKIAAYWNGDIAWVTPKDLSQHPLIFTSSGENYITGLGLAKGSAKLLPTNTILFSSRAPIGYISIAKNNLATNQGFKSVIPNKEYSFQFIYELLKHETTAIKNEANGSTFKEISGKKLKQHIINIPNSEDTSKFNEITKPIFKQLRKLEEENEKLLAIKKELLEKYF